MSYNLNNLMPYIPASDYEKVATEFLETYYPQALSSPQPVPILDIAKNELKLDLKFICLSEELDIYGMTIFDDGVVEVYDPVKGLYDKKKYSRKTVLIDPDVVKKTNVGCLNNTIAHECVHWYKHRMYYLMQRLVLPRHAKFCKCQVDQVGYFSNEEDILENQAIGIAPKILMPKQMFVKVAEELGINDEQANWREINRLADFFKVSKQSTIIRLEECNII